MLLTIVAIPNLSLELLSLVHISIGGNVLLGFSRLTTIAGLDYIAASTLHEQLVPFFSSSIESMCQLSS